MIFLNIISFLGIFGVCAIAWLFSENRRVLAWRTIGVGIGLQLVMAALVFRFEPTRAALQWFSSLLDSVFLAADTGASFVFGKNIVPLPTRPADINLGYIFAFRALPAVIFFSGLMALLENLGLIQIVTNFFARLFYQTMRLSGAESLSGAANIFVGIEAAIVVKPYLPKMTRSELCAILSCCFGTAASSTLAIYVSFLRPVFPNILGHLVSASIIAIPACFVISKILVPETETPLTMGGIPTENEGKKEKKKNQKVEEELSQPRALVDEDFPPPLSLDGDDFGQPMALQIDGEMVAEREDRNELYTYQSREMETTTPEVVKAEEDEEKLESAGGEVIKKMSPLDAAIVGSIDGVKMSVSIAAVLILILGLVSILNQTFGWLASLSEFTFTDSENILVQPLIDFGRLLLEPIIQGIGALFTVVNLANIEGALFYPLTLLTGVSLDDSWQASVIIGRRLLETAIPPYQALAEAASKGEISGRTVLIVSYALSGFAHLASVGIFVGGTIALIPSRRKDISELGWKALLAGTLATVMISCLAGVFDNGDASILGTPEPQATPAPLVSPSPTPAPSLTPTSTPTR